MNQIPEDRAEFITMGCRLNLAESSALEQQLGHVNDLIVVNSCAVTNEAVRQTRQAIRKARKRRTRCADYCNRMRRSGGPG